VPEFIVRARAASTDPATFMASVGSGAHVEYLAHMITNALMVSKGHREDTTLHLVLEDSDDFSRCISLQGEQLGDLGGTTEAALLNVIKTALQYGQGLAKEASVLTPSGVKVTAISFEHLVKARVAEGPVYVLDPKGEDIREAQLPVNAVFLLTDHVPMPKKTFKSMQRQGVNKLSLGPLMLHASQCITVIQNELDRRYLG
jgi:tRNA (pseudouridine54-N1)-methyltransferase